MAKFSRGVGGTCGKMFRRQPTSGVKSLRSSRLALQTLEPRLVLDAGPLVISELMAINGDTLADEDGEYLDWIEIYNPTGAEVPLDGWFLTDDPGNLTKWRFPDVSVAADDYRVVFASDKDRRDPLGELHTNFKLSGSGEYLALVQDDESTIAHEYAPEFPRQLEDVSYGLPSAATAFETLVPSGAVANYHVPTAGDDVLAWTTPTYDDSAWVDTFTIEAAGLLITEIATGDTRLVEIQNVSDAAIDATGWSVLVNDASTADVNAVNGTAWSLPGSIASAQVLYRTDDVADNYFGSEIRWDPEGSGWAMIIDDAGQVMDFAVWGYTAAEIAALDVDYGRFTNITVGDQFSGDGAAVGSTDPGGPGDTGLVAFNDHVVGPGTHVNATTYATNGTSSGLFKDVATGLDTTARLTLTQSGVNFQGASNPPSPGTDAYDVFNGFVDFGRGAGDASIEIAGADHYTHTFAGLDTGDAATYRFQGTAIRGGGYDDRWTLVTLVGADSATATHSSGIGVVVVSPTEVALWVGENDGPNQGFVAGWTDIDPGADGDFSIVSTQYTGPTPGVGSGTADGSKGYGLSGIRLEEVLPSGPLSWLKRSGGFDTDTAADFVRSTESSQGTQNPDLTVPFGTVLPVSTGLGFSDGQPEFEANIATDVGQAMQGVNGSLWTRIEFDVAEPSVFDELTLRMKYDDGFVAYLSGVEVARVNAPDVLAYDSTATDLHLDPLAVVFEDFGISEHLAMLQTGFNVLAIHGLNVEAADADLLILPELIATANLGLPQYMATPTPWAENVPGALGLVDDTKFSVDRGFYDAPFQVEITTDTNGAVIRYTTDGSPPTETTGSVYSGPITVATTTTLRAAAYKPGYIPTNVDTQTYLFLDDVIRQDANGLPDTWGYSGGNIMSPPGPDYEMDPDVVNDPRYSGTIRDDLKSIPTMSLVTDMDNWFGTGGQGIYVSGVGVERPVSVEYFADDAMEPFHINGSVEIQGGGFGGTSANRWKSYKLSMQLKFKEIYGEPKLRYPLYGDEGAGEFDTLILDAHLNMTWTHPSSGQQRGAMFIQDGFISDLQNGMGGYAPHGRWVHLYLNGLYWGMYELHERPDEHFAEAYLGGVDDDYNVLKHSMNNTANNANDVPNAARTSYQNMLNLVRQDMSVTANYDAALQTIDPDALIDYMLANFYGGNTDWAHKNWYASQNAVDPDGRWRFHSWDAEHAVKSVNENVTGKNNSNGPTEVHTRLTANAEYRMLFADHVHKHFHNGGVLSPTGAAALYQARMTEVDRAIVGESARWGDNRQRYDPYTRDDWLATQNGKLSSYFPQRTNNVLGYLRARNLYPSVDAPVYRVNGSSQYGGAIDPEDSLSITGSGTIYYTLDGSDPRLPGAVQFSGAPMYLDESTLLKSRVLSGSTWSALSEARFYVGTSATAANLVATEINYHPHDPTPAELAIDSTWLDGDFEFIELKNISGEWIDLTTVEFARGITFDFTDSAATRLDPGESTVLVRNPAAFAQRYDTDGILIAGSYDENLANNGERIKLLDRFGEPIFNFSYNDGGGWPGKADGKGASLVLIDPASVPTADPARTDFLENDDNWRSSVRYGGSPGAEPESALGVVVNEVLTHTDLPQKDTIELINTTAGAIDLGGWYLSDSWGWESDPNNGHYKKFRIPDGTSIPAGGYVVFDEDDFNPTPGSQGPNHFALNGAHGDDVWLMKADAAGNLTHFADHLEFDAAANGESWGRWPNGLGDPYPMRTPTLDKANPQNGENSGPRVGPVIISELHYNPTPLVEDDDLEFIEIYNPTSTTVNLTDWRIRKGIDFNFPAGFTLESGAAMIVVPFDPSDTDKLSAFYDEYWPGGPVPPELVILGGYRGRLNDDGERVRLQRGDEEPAGEPGFIPRLLEDEVRYDDEAPWPSTADGLGSSLNRLDTDAWGNSPTSWGALPPTPGTTTFEMPQPEAEVVGRHVFYNGSSFDAYDSGAGASDDEAIAPDKAALLPGQTATRANYTSYSRGINGIMIDIDALPPGADPDADDFRFRTGNGNDLALWTEPQDPPEVTVRRGAGVGGSDRLTLIWPDNTIQKQWLQVTVRTTFDTGLAEAEVFYFGNAVGESGNSTTDAKVNAFDILGARDNQRNFLDPAPIDFAYDFDRDASVDATDMLIARNHQTHFLNALRLITVPAAKAAGPDAAAVSVATAGDAVFEQLAGQESERLFMKTSPGRFAWLHEFERIGIRQRPSEKGTPVEAVVDKLLAEMDR